MGVSGYFDRGARDFAASMPVDPLPPRRVVFRDSETGQITSGEGLEALIPTEGRIGDSRREIIDGLKRAEDERLITSLAEHLAHELRGWHEAVEIADAIRAWRDGQR